MTIRIAVLVSGRGSNLEAILQAIKDGELNAKVDTVISNRPDALALHVARKYGVHALAIDQQGISRQEHETRLLEELLQYPIDYIVLAGYMRVLSPHFLKHYKDPGGYYRVVNIHPSLLPAFPGASAYEDAFNAGVRTAGVTVHLVDEEVDQGPILAQESFPRLEDDTLETFKARGLVVEHKLFPKTLKQIAENGVRINSEHKAKSQGTINTMAEQLEVDQIICLALVPRAGFELSQKPLEFPLYWLKADRPVADMLDDETFTATLSEILTNPLVEKLWIDLSSGRSHWTKVWRDIGFCFWAERQFLPGVTDNLAKTVEEALQLSGIASEIKVASGTGLLFGPQSRIGLNSQDEIVRFCQYRHFHPLTDRFLVHDLKVPPAAREKFLEFPQVHLPDAKPIEVVTLDLNDVDLQSLSRSRILALSLPEMKAIRQHFEKDTVQHSRKMCGLPQWPTDVELEIIAQTWSEHCKHKIFNATINHTDYTKAKPLQRTTINSLYKTYIQSATEKIAHKRADLLSVFEDNAGVVRFNDDWGICFKVETHNSPSALEPYGGALTGILGVNRDILGTGLGAKPILNTDVFCFAYPAADLPQRPTMLPAEAIIQGVRKGVQDGGNKSGIPTVNGAVYFHPGYRAKPLVFCGTGGLLPLKVKEMIGYKKHTCLADVIVMVGGRIGKDGIHGATFSSEALHEGSPVSAVQIGDPFTQKRLLDFILEARDAGLISGITDNGAGGLSSSVGEMAQITGGATLELDNIPLKYPGLADWEIVVSESQERMTISTKKLAELKELANKHRVEITAIGTFHNKGYFEVTRNGKPIAMLDLSFLHEGVPKMELESVWTPPVLKDLVGPPPPDLATWVLKLLAHPNISSRESIIRQYDHEVQGRSVIKPLMGPLQQAPSDAAVIKPLFDDEQGLVIANGLCPALSEYDTYLMAQCAVDEAIRNAVAVGADPATLSLLDNFCWPDPIASKRNIDGKIKLAQLVRACEGLFDTALTFATPLISGKDSMKNDFDDSILRLSIPPTLLVSAIGKMPKTDEAVTSEFKHPGDLIYLLGAGDIGLAGSQYLLANGWSSSSLPSLSRLEAASNYNKLHQAMKKGWIKSCHDLSEGGLAVAIAECVIGSGLGAHIFADQVIAAARSLTNGKDNNKYNAEILTRLDVALFGEGPARLLVTVSPTNENNWVEFWQEARLTLLGSVTEKNAFCLLDSEMKNIIDLDGVTLTKAWQAPMPFDEETLTV